MKKILYSATVILLFLSSITFAKDNPQVKLETDLGSFVIELYPEQAPKTVANFLQYVNDGFYIGTIFHRVVPGFVVQGGGHTFDFAKKETRDPVVNESNNGLKNKRGTIAMARMSDPDSATSQFFINTKDNDPLNAKNSKPGYTVFGKVIEGYDTIIKIEKEPRGLYRHSPEAPNYPIRILKTYVVK